MAEILEKILAQKEREIAQSQRICPVERFRESPFFSREVLSLRRALTTRVKPGIIAEFKRRSPSAGWLNETAAVDSLTPAYVAAGACALSILTDQEFFGGSTADLQAARERNICPILRKDFIISEYQVMEAKAKGADVVLLISRILAPERQAALAALAHEIGLEVLLEIHSPADFKQSPLADIDLIGVNSRDLDTLTVDLNRSLALVDSLPPDLPKIAESGLGSAAALRQLWAKGYRGFLIGEFFMRQSDPAAACARLLQEWDETR